MALEDVDDVPVDDAPDGDVDPDADGAVDEDLDEPTLDVDADPDDDAAEGDEGDDPAADDVDDSDDDEGKAPAKGRSAKLDKLLGKYGDDPDKMVDAYFEQANSMSKLAGELREIKEQLVAKKEDPKAEAEYVNNDSEVKEYATELASLDTEVKAVQQTQTAMVADFGKLDKQIARLEGELERASVEDRSEIREKLNDAKADMKSLQRDWKDAQRELLRLANQQRTVARQFRTAEANAKVRRESEIQRESDRAQAQVVTQQEFLGTIEGEAAKYGLKTDSKTYMIVQQAIKERIVSVLRSMPKGSPPINLPNAVKSLMAEYAEELELKNRFKTVSKQKNQVTPKREPTGKPNAGKPASSKLSPKTAEYWRQRARQMEQRRG